MIKVTFCHDIWEGEKLIMDIKEIWKIAEKFSNYYNLNAKHRYLRGWDDMSHDEKLDIVYALIEALKDY